jgi:chemotaxis signal transduction protein
MTGAADIQAILDQRARDLAEPPGLYRPLPPVLVCRGRSGRWALALEAVARVEELPEWTPLPGRPDAILGLGVIGRRRMVLADLDSLLAGVPARPRDRPGHAVALRGSATALAVDRVEAVEELDFAAAVEAGPGRAMAWDGTVLLDAGRLVAAIEAREVG